MADLDENYLEKASEVVLKVFCSFFSIGLNIST